MWLTLYKHGTTLTTVFQATFKSKNDNNNNKYRTKYYVESVRNRTWCVYQVKCPINGNCSDIYLRGMMLILGSHASPAHVTSRDLDKEGWWPPGFFQFPKNTRIINQIRGLWLINPLNYRTVGFIKIRCTILACCIKFGNWKLSDRGCMVNDQRSDSNHF